jgi:hypothetical protein
MPHESRRMSLRAILSIPLALGLGLALAIGAIISFLIDPTPVEMHHPNDD